ncbi:MAG: VWA domain-containing protein [Candidatus Sericytochromatia bacterium]
MMHKQYLIILFLLSLVACTQSIPTNDLSKPSASPSASAVATSSPAPSGGGGGGGGGGGILMPNMPKEQNSAPEYLEEQTIANPNQKQKYFYLSYDDSASTASVELAKFQLMNNRLPNNNVPIRPWEFLNYETFQKQNQTPTGLFQISMGLSEAPQKVSESLEKKYYLGVHVSAPVITKEERKNLVLTLVVDVSGSMNEPSFSALEPGPIPSRFELLKFGLKNLWSSLKPGDIVNLVEFSNNTTTILENLVYLPTDTHYLDAIDGLELIAGTNLEAGLAEGYRIAQKYFDDSKLNRVLLLTDAYANVGDVNVQNISSRTIKNQGEGIYFSGLGIGENFNQTFLNQMTEAGKGAFFPLITRQDVKKAFQDRFMALVNVAARNVRFRLEYPEKLIHGHTAAEQISLNPQLVDPTHFSFNTSQYFLEEFIQKNSELTTLDTFTLKISYQDPLSDTTKTEVYQKKRDEIINQDVLNLAQARLITRLTSLMNREIEADEAFREEILRLKNMLGENPLGLEYLQLVNQWLRLNGKEPIK